ncbi:MAG: ATP-dependent DNA ligase [Thaumarchaeota archaeon]|nr:ATP-dependent DNA ligase [Nitrososphaerota archaeon]
MTSFLEFARVAGNIRATSSKTEKVSILSGFLAQLNEEELPLVCRYFSGYLFPRWTEKEVFAGYSLLWNMVAELCSMNPRDLGEVYRKYGDLGDVAEEVLEKKVVQPLFKRQLSVTNVQQTFDNMSKMAGKGSQEGRRQTLKGLFLDCSPAEAKYLTKLLLGEMRIGLVEGLVEESVAKVFGKSLEEVRTANLTLGDIGETATLAMKNELYKATLQIFRPTTFMLAETMETAADIAQYYQKKVYAEFKYDGIRAQVHKADAKVKVYSRRLEDISWSFPDLVQAILKIPNTIVLDGEILPFKDNNPLPFQELQRRIRKKSPTKEIMEELPVVYKCFDILYLDGKVLIEKPLLQRRRFLRNLKLPDKIQLSRTATVSSVETLQKVFEASKKLGYEGLVVKDPTSPYWPGRRGKYWIKLKKELDTLDVVVVAAEFGHGKRAGTISDYTFAVRDNAEFRVVGKAYSGLSDEEIHYMTERVKALLVQDFGYRMLVKPEIILEVAFDAIQKSDRHDSGYALRFPRIKRIRLDKNVDEIDTLQRVQAIYEMQKTKK